MLASRLLVPATSHAPSGVRSRPLTDGQPPARTLQSTAPSLTRNLRKWLSPLPQYRNCESALKRSLRTWPNEVVPAPGTLQTKLPVARSTSVTPPSPALPRAIQRARGEMAIAGDSSRRPTAASFGAAALDQMTAPVAPSSRTSLFSVGV